MTNGDALYLLKWRLAFPLWITISGFQQVPYNYADFIIHIFMPRCPSRRFTSFINSIASRIYKIRFDYFYFQVFFDFWFNWFIFFKFSGFQLIMLDDEYIPIDTLKSWVLKFSYWIIWWNRSQNQSVLGISISISTRITVKFLKNRANQHITTARKGSFNSPLLLR